METTRDSSDLSLATSSSIIDQLLPQAAGPTGSPWSNSMPLAYSSASPFKNSLSSYHHHHHQQQHQSLSDEDGRALFGLMSATGSDHQQQQQHHPLYNSLNFSSDSSTGNTSRHIFNNLSDISSGNNNLIDNLNNQLSTSDSSNIFSGNSSFSSGRNGGNGAGSQTQGARQLATTRPEEEAGIPASSSAEVGRTYSSVLHSTAHLGLSPFQRQLQQQQQQSPYVHSAHHQTSPLVNNSGPMAGGQQQLQQHQARITPTNLRQYQQMNSQARFIEDFLSSGGASQQQQQQMQRQCAPYQRAPRQQQQQQPFGAYGPAGQFHAPAIAPIGGRGFNSRNSNIGDRTTASGSGPPGSAASATANKRRNKLPFFAGANVGTSSQQQQLGEGQLGFKLDTFGTGVINSEESERFSRKVFVGGLPPDIDEEEIKASFRRFGPLVVDWPHKAESKSYFPPKGYAFLLFQEEVSVQSLIDSCFQEEDKLYLCVSSPTIKDKPVQIRPWRLNDSDFVLDSTLALDPRKTVFVGGVPRPLKACELATIMNNLYGGVSYAGIDTDPDLKYPKGAGRVAFSNHQSYIAAISARFVHIRHGEIEKRVEVKPYVLDDQFCDECHGSRCNNKFAPFFCANITCLRYYCDSCWTSVHSQAGKDFHKPLVKEGGDRPRGASAHQSSRW